MNECNSGLSVRQSRWSVWPHMNECNSGAPRKGRLCLKRQKRPSRWAGWSCMIECKQRTAKQIEDAPQSPAEAVEAVTLQLLHSLRNMGRERAVRSFEKLREKRALPAVLEEGFAALIQRFPFEKYRRISNVHRFFQANTGVNHVRLKSHAKQKTMEIENCQIRGLASQDSPY